MIVSVVSYRGGSGKSLFSLNLAKMLDRKVLLVDADFLAPSLHFIPDKVEYYWNDYLSGKVTRVEDMVYKMSGIDLVCTQPNDTKIIPQLMDKNLWSTTYSDNLSRFASKYDAVYDYIILDNQSGTFYSTLLHCFFSDLLIVVVRPDKRDVVSTAEYLKLLKKPFYVVWNHMISPDKMGKYIDSWLEMYYRNIPGFRGELGRIPFDEESAFQVWSQQSLFPRGEVYLQAMEDIVRRFVGLTSER